jgi:hypothetical protein
VLLPPDAWAQAVQQVSLAKLRQWIGTQLSHRPLWTLAGQQAALRQAERSLRAANAH